MAESRENPKVRKSTDELRDQSLESLAANGGDLNETARQLQNISESILERGRDHNRNTSPSASNDRQLQDMAAALESIGWLLVRAMPEKIAKAPLNQLASTLKTTLETIRSIRNEQLTRDKFPFDLSKMSNEQLEQLEQLTTLVLGYLQSLSISGHSGPGIESDEDGDGVDSSTLESPLSSRPLSSKVEDS